jgi:ubiquinone/menaquinone biosynthesis C-methylase UbiE
VNNVTTPPNGKEFWEKTAARYDTSMVLLGGPLQAMKQRVAHAVEGCDRVLELAAGTGLVTEAIAPVVNQVLATDYSAAMVAKLDHRVRAGKLTNVETATLDVYQLRDEAAFDAIVATNVLHLLPDVNAAIATMVRSIRPGGLLVVPTYCHDQTHMARVTSGVMGWFGFPGQRRLNLQTLVSLLQSHPELAIEETVLLTGILPIGFVTARRRAGPAPL